MSTALKISAARMRKIRDAIGVLGKRRQRWALSNMVRALSFHSWSNTEEENARLIAARFALRNWRAFNHVCMEGETCKRGKGAR